MKAFIFAGCAILALLIGDCAGGTTETVQAVVVGREFEPGHYNYHSDEKGRVTSTYVDDDYDLIVREGDAVHQIDTNRKGYYTVYEGQRIAYTQRRGCMSHSIWLASFYP